MLYPKSNVSRFVMDLGGIWDFRLHEGAPWQTIAVPASYNDQKADPEFRAHVGFAWYRRQVSLPAMLAGQRCVLRFDAVTHDAVVLVNGTEVCRHKGGFLPFELDLDGIAVPGETFELTVRVDNRINHGSLPVGNEGGVAFFGSDNAGIPAVEAGKRRQVEQGINLPNFDFFNYAGLTRPVRLCTMPKDHIEDITLVPALDGTVRYSVETVGEGIVHIAVEDAAGKVVAEADGASGTVKIDDPQLWEPWPGTPYLYNAKVTFANDRYEQTFGIREFRVDGIRVLLNGKPIHLHGPSRHEDSYLHGRGMDQVVNVNDASLFHWVNANVTRTSHYPDAEEWYDLCDREGILVIDETPAVGIGGPTDPYTTWPGMPEYHAEILRRLINRDKNHPCVVMWSLGNEPDTVSFPESSYQYWHRLYELAHELDPQGRPVTMVGCQNDYTKDITTRSMDVVCINRYYGWYNLSGDLENAGYALRQELDWWDQVGKPMILTEYGADTINGMHGAYGEMFTEEFQVAYYEAINACLDERPYFVGEMPWVFADFNTIQGPMRAIGNRKGLFTRDRKPKLSAHYFRKRWDHFEK